MSAGLTDRLSERAALSQLVDAVRNGYSRVLVMRGDPGVGKTALLDYLAEQVRGHQAEAIWPHLDGMGVRPGPFGRTLAQNQGPGPGVAGGRGDPAGASMMRPA